MLLNVKARWLHILFLSHYVHMTFFTSVLTFFVDYALYATGRLLSLKHKLSAGVDIALPLSILCPFLHACSTLCNIQIQFAHACRFRRY